MPKMNLHPMGAVKVLMPPPRTQSKASEMNAFMRVSLTQNGTSPLNAINQQLAQGMVVSLPWVVGDLSRLAVPVEARDALAGRAAHDAIHLPRQGD